MKTPQNFQDSFNENISIVDIINSFNSHKKLILIFVILGTLLGCLYGNFTEPIYKGSVLISPAKVSGIVLVNPKITLTKLSWNSYYSKETFLNCNPEFYNDKDKHKDKDKDKDFDYNISDLVKTSITKDGEFIQLLMQNKNKTVIKNCLNSIVNDIRASQNKSADTLIQSKNIELMLLEEEFKKTEQFKIKLNDKQIKELKSNGEHFREELLYTNKILSNINDRRQIIVEINKLKTELSYPQTKSVENELPINIEKKYPLLLEFSALFGLFLGLCLGVLLALKKQLKVYFF